MSNSGLEVFDTTIQETNHWLKIVMEELDTPNRRQAFTALRAVLHAVRDLIGPANAVHLGAQLPMLLRGAYYEGWRLADTPTRERRLYQFLEHVALDLPRNAEIDPEAAARATFSALTQCLDRGAVEKLARVLPQELRLLFPVPTI